ncbi:nucleotidyl transferase AbiEii/AbiGii toxin family protein [Asticcacaulis solisilvae]|uniref:nucleotidyl transferase AbiEii/AbiGii toxin family protein n=1 Tax=Asticcacaulis solisilvae TaxID=1217274 RepID=UPI003FD7B943
MTTFAPRTDILPEAQRQLRPYLAEVTRQGFVLYGGTAIALRLGHRVSVDFDFFHHLPLDRNRLYKACRP